MTFYAHTLYIDISLIFPSRIILFLVFNAISFVVALGTDYALMKDIVYADNISNLYTIEIDIIG